MALVVCGDGHAMDMVDMEETKDTVDTVWVIADLDIISDVAMDTVVATHTTLTPEEPFML